MKLQELAQNLGLRIGTIQIIAFVLLTLLGVRLYYLQIVKGDYYAERAENQRIRLIPIPAPRGAIFDRNGKILVDSRPTFNVVISNEPLKEIKVEERVDSYAAGLNLESQLVVERINAIKKQNDFETLVLKDNATMEDIAWVEAHSLEYPELRIELQPQRFYPHGTIAARRAGPGLSSPTSSATSARSALNSLNQNPGRRRACGPATLSARVDLKSITTSFCAAGPDSER